MSHLHSILTPEFALWACAVLLLMIVVTLERLGRAIAQLHELLYRAHEENLIKWSERGGR